MKKGLKLLAAISVAAFAITGCSANSGGGSSDTLKIGLAAPLSGASAQDGESIKKGVELAIKLANDAGGIDGKQLSLTALDDKGDPKEATNVANKLASDKSVLAVVGHFNSSATLAGAPVYNRNKIVEVSPGSSSPKVTDAGDYTFRVITTDAFQGEFVAKWTKEEGLNKVAILYEQTDYGVGLADVYQKAAEANGIQIVASEAYTAGQTKDFASVLTKIKEKQPNAIFIGGLYNEAALIAKQAKQQGIQVPFLGVDALFSDALIKLGGDAVEGFLIPGFFNPNSDAAETKKFVDAYKAAHNSDPGTYAAYAFDATNIIIESIKKNGADREKIQQYMSSLKGFKGATGVNDFDEKGDVLKNPEKLIVKDGKFQPYKK
ncbi:branched-chain amino acid ABC transporter substrate-binding protein [Cohnella kolymensis]|uniref:Branched-chain amino acid ABC transporter substrate-binding protein n=1 Tax=Cohnella kolymensis TaxID=1590652 RepID=A0ABR5A445_9BACL|nr:ABC transporter substrate-binding protein [Cohnella kolymensis]KIL35765.1 branched-chain amino acid ABC transporter substrate-binding protein [Cohnella kolymensis]